MRAAAEAIREVACVAGKADGGEQAAAAATGTGWATLKRPVRVRRHAARRCRRTTSPRTRTSAPINGKAPLQETLVVDTGSKGIKNVVVFLRDASRVHDSAKPKADTVVFDQKECVFLTHVLRRDRRPIARHQEQRQRRPQHEHRRARTGFNQTIPAGATIPYKVQKEEAMPHQVTCSIHPWMTAYMLPRKNGYFAVTDADGTFEIANVPAGEPLEFQVWHESARRPGQRRWSATRPKRKDAQVDEPRPLHGHAPAG